ncbi:hypothetical protein [Microbulbifer sp. TRSA005]|uniref:hypothetical protein n=1 Tax=unclassified Microbulbifer TaxID=2619833 RepID=UPI00403A109B
MRKIYLHIGTHKTGTSSIQKFMSDNYSNLIKYGFLYPKVARVSHGSHHNLQFQITNDPRYKTKLGGWVELLKEINESNCENVVLSCEAFSTLQGGDLMPHYIYSFAQKYRFDIDVICYLRPQYELIESLWLQETKSGQNILSIDDYVTKQLPKPRFNYFDLLRSWSSYFHTTFFSYNRCINGDGVLPCFLSTIGVPSIYLNTSQVNVNNRVSFELTDLIRRLTSRFWKQGLSKMETERWAHKFRKKYSDFGEEYGVLSHANVLRIYDQCKVSNERVIAKYPYLKGDFEPFLKERKNEITMKHEFSARDEFLIDLIVDLSLKKEK